MPLCFLYLLFLLCLKARHALGTVCISMDYGDYARLYAAVRDCARRKRHRPSPHDIGSWPDWRRFDARIPALL
jgi:hypothetical protein